MQKEKIGIFWYYDQKLMVKASALTEVKPVAGYADYEVTHHEVWDSLRFSNPELFDDEYDEVPRGRVIFNANQNLFYVYSSAKLISDRIFQGKVLEQFILPRAKTIFKADEHYEPPNTADL